MTHTSENLRFITPARLGFEADLDVEILAPANLAGPADPLSGRAAASLAELVGSRRLGQSGRIVGVDESVQPPVLHLQQLDAQGEPRGRVRGYAMDLFGDTDQSYQIGLTGAEPPEVQEVLRRLGLSVGSVVVESEAASHARAATRRLGGPH